LNSKIGQEYVDFLVIKGYLGKTVGKDRILFTTTPAAKGYTEIFMKLYLELFKNTPEFKL
jgi:predicted transcriptional regulator